MQIINKILFDSNNWTQFIWLQYLPSWISPFWFYLCIWFLILFLGIDWKKNTKIMKKIKKNINWNEDIYFFWFVNALYAVMILYSLGVFSAIISVVVLLLVEITDYAEYLENYLFEINEELDNRWSIWHKFTVIWKEFLDYWKK